MITLSHSDEEGTRAQGTSKGDGSAEVLKAAGFRWSSVGWIIRGSRWHAPRLNLDSVADRLRAAGFDVAVEVDLAPAAPEVKAAAQDAASDARIDRLTAKAERVGAQSEATLARARELGDQIPFGQPILVGHHSEGRHRRHIAKIESTYGKAFELSDEAAAAAAGADASVAHQAHRADPRTILRRIDRNGADLRRWQRSMAKTDRAAHPDWWARAEAEVTRLTEAIRYDREQVAAAEAAGAVKVWSAADFVKGDLAEVRYGGRCVVPVVRVNAKSLSVRIDGRSWTDTVPYSDVLGKVAPAAEV